MTAVSEAYMLIADFALSLGVVALNKHVGCWEHKLGDRWTIAVNGHRTPTQTSAGVEVLPYHAYVERDGWPGGLLTPAGGTMVGGIEAEDDLIRELKLAIHGPEDAR